MVVFPGPERSDRTSLVSKGLSLLKQDAIFGSNAPVPLYVKKMECKNPLWNTSSADEKRTKVLLSSGSPNDWTSVWMIVIGNKSDPWLAADSRRLADPMFKVATGRPCE